MQSWVVFSQDHHGGLFTLYDNDMMVTLCLVKLLSYFPILFYYCCGDRIVCVLGSARIILLVIYVYLRCLASPHSCGLLARCPFTCKQGVILRLFLSRPTRRIRHEYPPWLPCLHMLTTLSAPF